MFSLFAPILRKYPVGHPSWLVADSRSRTRDTDSDKSNDYSGLAPSPINQTVYMHQSTNDVPVNAAPKETYRAVYVHARLTPGTLPWNALRADLESTGLWEVRVPCSLTDSHAANCALDHYHSNVPVKWLEYFEFVVLDPESEKELFRDENFGGYEFDHLGYFVGRICHMG